MRLENWFGGRKLKLLCCMSTEVFGSHAVEPQKKQLSRFVLFGRESDGKKEVSAGKVVLLFQRVMKKLLKELSLRLRGIQSFTPPLDDMDRTLSFFCVQWAATGSEK